MLDGPTNQAADLAAIYRDEAAPRIDELFGRLKTSLTTDELSEVAKGGPVPEDPDANPPAPSTEVRSPVAEGVLERLKPLGITSLAQLRPKTDEQLRQLSRDVVAYEMRQAQLSKFFFKNADGTFDFTRGPDGKPTGLDANGNVAPREPTPPPDPAPAPKPTAPKTSSPAPKPTAPKTTSRPAPSAPPQPTTVTPPPAPKPVAKKPRRPIPPAPKPYTAPEPPRAPLPGGTRL